jgi:hypothetical protein
MLRGSAAAALVLLVATATAVSAAPISVTATPLFHGTLRVRRASGTVDRKSGAAVVNVRRWSLELAPGSNGIYPDQEPIVLAIGEDTFRLDAGMLKAHGKSGFLYRARPRSSRGIQSLAIKQSKDGSYSVQFSVRGVLLSGLEENAPLCLPTAFIVGDDDGFSGVNYDSPGSPPIVSRRVLVGNGFCSPQAWPWA